MAITQKENSPLLIFSWFGNTILSLSVLKVKIKMKTVLLTRRAEYDRMYLIYGSAMASTGILRYDKRVGQDNPVKMSKFKK
jgi:uncharacterized membrane protein